MTLLDHILVGVCFSGAALLLIVMISWLADDLAGRDARRHAPTANPGLAELHDWMDAKLAPDLLAVDRTRRVRRRGIAALEYTAAGSGMRRAMTFVTTADLDFVDQFFDRNTDFPPDELFPDYLNRQDPA